MDMNYFFTVNANHTRLKLYKSRFNGNTRKFIFSQRIINDWNSLPHDVVSAPNVFIFRTKLDVLLLFNRRFDYA